MTDLRKLLAEATPGPWRVGPVDDTVVVAADGSEIAAIDGDYNEPDLWPMMEANARLIALAAALIKAEEALAEATEIVHKEYVRATLEAVDAGPSHPLQKQVDAWRIRCMKSEASSRAALSEIRALTGGNDD